MWPNKVEEKEKRQKNMQMKVQKATAKMCPHPWDRSNGLTGLQVRSMWVMRSTSTNKLYFLPQISPNSTDWLDMAH